MNECRINLKNEKLTSYNRLSKIIIFILFIFFSYHALFTEVRHIRIKSIGTIALLLSCFGLHLYFSKTKYNFSYHPYFFIILIGWANIENYWMLAISFVFYLFYTLTNRKLEVYISKNQILYPAIPLRKINWNEISQLILKDGLLTIDFKSNKLIQQTIDKLKTHVDEKEFNDFCKQQLNK